MYKPNSMWTWAFVAVTTIQGALVLAFESYVFALFQTSLKPKRDPKEAPDSNIKTIPTFLTLYIFGFIYELCLVYDALRLKNTIQIIGLCIYNYALLIYAAIQITQINDAVTELRVKGLIETTVWAAERPFLIAIPCIIAVGSLCMSFVARKLYDEFAWTIYKHISADLKMKRRYLTFQIYIAILKFDFFFFLGFTIQFIVIVVDINRDRSEFWVTIAAIPVTILILIAGSVFTRREIRSGMIVIILLYFAGLAYFIFKLARMYQTGYEENYKPVRKSLTAFAVLAIILLLMTISNAIACLINFGQGLRPYIARRKVDNDEEKPNLMMEMPNLAHGGVAPSRMTID